MDHWRGDGGPSAEPAPTGLADVTFRWYADGACQLSGYRPGTRDPRPIEVADPVAVELAREHVEQAILILYAAAAGTPRPAPPGPPAERRLACAG